MLGLGDIVVPGFFLICLLHFDMVTTANAGGKERGFSYFFVGMISYVVSLVVCIVIMHVFRAAQPALLYIVPAVTGTALAAAVGRREFGLLWSFDAVALLEKEEQEREAAQEKKQQAKEGQVEANTTPLATKNKLD